MGGPNKRQARPDSANEPLSEATASIEETILAVNSNTEDLGTNIATLTSDVQSLSTTSLSLRADLSETKESVYAIQQAVSISNVSALTAVSGIQNDARSLVASSSENTQALQRIEDMVRALALGGSIASWSQEPRVGQVFSYSSCTTG